MFHPLEGGCCCPACSAIEAVSGDTSAAEANSTVNAGSSSGSSYSSESGKPIYDNAGIVYALTTFDGASASAAWAADTVTYSISSGSIALGEVGFRSEYLGYVEMSAGMQAAAVEAFELWDDIIAIDLELSADDVDADILFNYSSQTSGGGTYSSSSYSFEYTERADWALGKNHIWAASNWWTHDQDTDLYQGGYGVLTYLHEIGHALGLSHPGNYNGSGSFDTDATHHQDTRGYTVLSYFNASENGSGADHYAYTGWLRYGATPLLHDILAAQTIYGADMTTRTGDTTYGFNSNAGRTAFDFTQNNAPVVAIWDAGGEDTLDLSGFTENQVITLVEGEFSSVGPQTQNVVIAYGAVIENAVGGSGADEITGNAAANILAGGLGDDSLFGGDGDDTLEGGDGADILNGGNGFDIATYASEASAITVDLVGANLAGAAALDSFVALEGFEGTAFADVLIGDAGIRFLSGLAGNDTLRAGSGADTLLGGDGDDWLEGGDGADRIEGGEGTDTADYAASASAVNVTMNVGGSAGAAAGDVLASIERIVGSAFGDTLTAAGTGTTVLGGGGNDFLYDFAGSAVLDGGEGDDTLNGGSDADVLIGGAGRDVVRYANAGAGVTVDLATGGASSDAEGDTYEGIEDVTGSMHADVVFGDAIGNLLSGLDGDDSLFGGEGDDTLEGGDGADWLDGGSGHDTASYGSSGGSINIGIYRTGSGAAASGDSLSGIERIVGSGYSDVLVGGGVTPVTLEGGSGNDQLYDYGADSLLFGGEGYDVLIGNGGDDTLFGGDGNDFLFGGAGADSVNGGDGTDYLSFAGASGAMSIDLAAGTGSGGDADGDSYAGIECVLSGDGNDSIVGDDAFNILYGMGGDDTIDGGGGNDYLIGGAGSDVFVFGSNWGRDLVFDWQDGIDRLDIRGTGLTLDDFTIVDTPQGTRLDWFDGSTTLAIHIFGTDPASIDSANFVL